MCGCGDTMPSRSVHSWAGVFVKNLKRKPWNPGYSNEALQHDNARGLIESALSSYSRREHIVRPGISFIERLVAKVRARAETHLGELLNKLLTSDQKRQLDALPAKASIKRHTPRRAAVVKPPCSISPTASTVRLAGFWPLMVVQTPNFPCKSTSSNGRCFCQSKSRPVDHRKVGHSGLVNNKVIVEK